MRYEVEGTKAWSTVRARARWRNVTAVDSNHTVSTNFHLLVRLLSIFIYWHALTRNVDFFLKGTKLLHSVVQFKKRTCSFFFRFFSVVFILCNIRLVSTAVK